MGNIFISYSRQDGKFIKLLSSRAEQVGLDLWIDESSVVPGDEWQVKVDEALRNAAAVVVVFSPSSASSKYVTYEWAFAWGAGVKIIPIVIENTELHPKISQLHWLDFTDTSALPWDRLFELMRESIECAYSNIRVPKEATISHHNAVKALSAVDSGERARAIYALEQIGDSYARKVLRQATRHTYPDVRKNAVKALSALSDRASLDDLARSLSDTSPDVAWEAARALANLGAWRAIRALVGAFVEGKVNYLNMVESMCLSMLSQAGKEAGGDYDGIAVREVLINLEEILIIVYEGFDKYGDALKASISITKGMQSCLEESYARIRRTTSVEEFDLAFISFILTHIQREKKADRFWPKGITEDTFLRSGDYTYTCLWRAPILSIKILVAALRNANCRGEAITLIKKCATMSEIFEQGRDELQREFGHAADALCRRLMDKEVHEDIECAICEIGAPAVGPLLEILTCLDRTDRSEALRLLALIRGREADDALVQARELPDLRDDVDKFIRERKSKK